LKTIDFLQPVNLIIPASLTLHGEISSVNSKMVFYVFLCFCVFKSLRTQTGSAMEKTMKKLSKAK